MSSPESFSIRDLADPRVHIEWHEAVGVAAEIGSWLVSHGRDRLPDLDGFGITVGGAPAVDASPTASEHAVRQLGRALGLLFDLADAPGPPRELAAAAAKAPDDDRVDQLVAALRYYERPDRPRLLAALGERAALVRAELDAGAELERLQERAREQAQKQREVEKPRPESPARRWSKRWTVAGAAALGLGSLAALMLVPSVRSPLTAAFSRYFAPPEIDPKPLADERPGDQGSKRETARPNARPSNGAQPALDGGEDGLADGRGLSAGQPGTAVGGEADPRGVLFTVITEDGGTPLAADVGLPGGAPVYSAASPGVTPPALLRQRLPSSPPPGIAPDDVGVFDLLIDETGSVERVQLASRTNRYQERMLLAAAKAWTFRPASIAGRPVRYRMKVRVTW